jgi:hypothetical protein
LQISREPESVTFSLWTGKMKPPPLTPLLRQKMRPWEAAHLNEARLKKDMKTVHDILHEVRAT